MGPWSSPAFERPEGFTQSRRASDPYDHSRANLRARQREPVPICGPFCALVYPLPEFNAYELFSLDQQQAESAGSKVHMAALAVLDDIRKPKSGYECVFAHRQQFLRNKQTLHRPPEEKATSPLFGDGSECIQNSYLTDDGNAYAESRYAALRASCH